MPVWSSISATAAIACSALTAAPRTAGYLHQDTFDEGALVVDWNRKVILPEEGKIIFSEGVKATYGITSLTADTLTLSTESGQFRKGVAEGNVKLTDPYGTLDANYIEFDWRLRRGTAQAIHLDGVGVEATAETVEVTEQKWVLTNVYGTPCAEGTPLLAFRSPRVEITPGQRVVARQASLYVLGAKIITLPKYTQSLGPRAEGLRFPSISYSQNAGFGLSWSNDFQLNQKTSLTAAFAARQRQRPGGLLYGSTSLLPPGDQYAPIIPRSDLEERFAFGYFDNVYVVSPDAERQDIGASSLTLSAGSAWNQVAVARREEEVFTKPLELVLDQAETYGGASVHSQLRLQSIRLTGQSTVNRLVASNSTLFPSHQIARYLRTHVRLDGMAFTSQVGTFAWGTAQAGLVFHPSSQFRLGAAYAYGLETGTPTFISDRLTVKNALLLRMDLDLGPTQLSFLAKYDTKSRNWYDHEVSLVQAAGCLEPFVVYRRFPRSVNFGIRLRVDQLLEALSRRDRRTQFGGSHRH